MMRTATLLLTAAALALAASAAHAVVPGQINYQGLLLDSAGDPVTGNEDFVFALYDAPMGGTSLWSETHDDVPVLDGVYDVVLGATTPITPALVSGGALHLEITVGGETLAPRQQLLAVPYAIEAESAASVDGLSSVFVTQAFEHFAFDGQDPPNQDASEGTGDTDGDGLPNFLDPDNDDDGIEDADELARGSDINLVTPTITAFDPIAADAQSTTTVTVTGQGFESGLSVAFGSQNPTPTSVTETSFDVEVGPQAEGEASVVVTNPNAETDQASFPFRVAAISGFDPPTADFDDTTTITVNGSGFAPGLQVSFGSEMPTVQNLTPTSFEVDVGPQAVGAATVTVSYPGGQAADQATFEFVDDTLVRRVFVTSTLTDGDLGGVAGADTICASLASAASLPGTFLAWIGDSTTDPATRFTRGGRYEHSSGTVADSFADLTDGDIDAGITRDETGAIVPLVAVWTGVAADGTAATTANDACADWTSDSAGLTGVRGVNSVTDARWTLDAITACSVARALYCFEQ